MFSLSVASNLTPGNVLKGIKFTFAGLFFNNLANSFLHFDRELYDNCSLDQGIKMEEMVKSREYFNNHLRERVAPELNLAAILA